MLESLDKRGCSLCQAQAACKAKVPVCKPEAIAGV
jgi:hypothetical protein